MGRNLPKTIIICFVLGLIAICAEAGTGLYMGPYFPSPLPRNITVHQDSVAYLPCTVKQLGDKSVSWVRQRDADILTVDRYTFVRDERLTVHYTAETETWTLVIKYVQERDAGSYECQISTEPKMSMLVHLNVIVPQVEITGALDKYVRKGSTARLECTVSSTVQLPDYIFWYHNGERLLEYDHPRVKFSVSRRGGQGSEMSITSTLVINTAREDDDGNYTCLPSNLHPATTILHVLNDEHPAAMQTGAAMLTDPPSAWGVLFVVFFAFLFVHAHQNLTVSTHFPRCSKTPQLELKSISLSEASGSLQEILQEEGTVEGETKEEEEEEPNDINFICSLDRKSCPSDLTNRQVIDSQISQSVFKRFIHLYNGNISKEAIFFNRNFPHFKYNDDKEITYTSTPDQIKPLIPEISQSDDRKIILFILIVIILSNERIPKRVYQDWKNSSAVSEYP